jgi:hypothetical protein
VYPQDIFECKDSTWVVGGRIIPLSSFLCEEEIYRQGIWVPSMNDLITWLEERVCQFTITHNGSSYKVEVSTCDDQKFKGKGISVEMGLFKVICQILKAYGGAPYKKNIT